MTSDRTRAREKPGCSRRGGIRSTRRFPEPIVLPGWSRTHTVMRGFSQRGSLLSLLSCPASGRPPYLEGEAAEPVLRPQALRSTKAAPGGWGEGAAEVKTPEHNLRRPRHRGIRRMAHLFRAARAKAAPDAMGEARRGQREDAGGAQGMKPTPLLRLYRPLN